MPPSAALRAQMPHPDEDRIVRRSNVSWAEYQRALDERGDCSGPRISFDRGELEIMAPSHTHEFVKSILGRLVEHYCFEQGIEFSALGAWTLSDKALARGVEPDECYVLGPDSTIRPQLAIEVIWTSGRLDKLPIYAALGVGEVWVWKKGVIRAHVLEAGRYREVEQSLLFPALDLERLAAFAEEPTTTRALMALRAWMKPG